jgi:hypothetical protein
VSRFSCLEVNDGENGESEDDSCSSEVPFDSALEVLHEPAAEEGWSTVAMRGRRPDEELGILGYRVSHARVANLGGPRSPASEGTTNDVRVCRSEGNREVGFPSIRLPSRSSPTCTTQSPWR